MATITRKSTKSAAKPKAEAAPKSNGRAKKGAIDVLIPAIVKDLQSGMKGTELLAKHELGSMIPVRAALARAGYTSKGQPVEVEKITGSGAALAKKVDARRRKTGEGWYLLAVATGKSEAELKALLSDNGYTTERVYVEKPAGEQPAPKPVAKKAAAKRTVTRKPKAPAADPS